MTSPARGLRLGFLEPHLRRTYAVERMVEFANRIGARGHDVTFYLPDEEILNCSWTRCGGLIKTWSSGFDDDLDVIVFCHESHWYLLDRFRRARRRVYYALHDPTVARAGRWESLRTPVDLQLAGSSWIAERILAETGHQPIVALGGVDRDLFRPRGATKQHPILCAGADTDDGVETIREAARLLDLPLEESAPDQLTPGELAAVLDAATVFVVGSPCEGFGQPGLEALASGVPLVTTDNGGSRQYAVDGETALVVPGGDAVAMANAIRRLVNDVGLRHELVSNGLEVVERDFDWERRTDELAEVLEGVAAGTTSAPPPPRPAPPAQPELSVVVLAWDNLSYTQDFVESARSHTDVPYELIIVDNGSRWEAADYAAAAGDAAVLNEANLGFAPGMNQGLAAARGRYIAFCNNDTALPPAWASRLIETAHAHPDAGIVVPALTAAGTPGTVRTEPGDQIVVLSPFSGPPPAVIYLMPTDVATGIGGWGEEYPVASGEDVDIGFKVWVNGLDIVFDERVLVAHVGKASAAKLDDWQARWANNRRLFLEKWSGDGEVPRLESCDEDTFVRNRAIAASVAEWMTKYFTARDKPRPVKTVVERTVVERSPFEAPLARIRDQLAKIRPPRRSGSG